ncbi:hypothetical protein ACJ41O_000217 [Fusarium nematophilum]
MPADTLSLDGKVAIVTGSGRETGIGAGIALALARNGAAVTLNCVSDSSVPRANALAEKIQKEGGKAAVVQTTVDTQDGAEYIIQETLKAFSTDHIDILVNNAGAAFFGGVLQHEPENIDMLLNVNFKGPIFMTQAVVPHMPQGGRIINVSSVASRRGEDSIPVYGAAKAALDSLTFSLAAELGKSRGITVNSVAPGPVTTDAIPKDHIDVFVKPALDITRAAHRFGTIEDIGDAVLLLASEKSRWITGQYISVSGGITGL